MICQRCGRNNAEGTRFCTACGAPLAAAQGGFERTAESPQMQYTQQQQQMQQQMPPQQRAQQQMQQQMAQQQQMQYQQTQAQPQMQYTQQPQQPQPQMQYTPQQQPQQQAQPQMQYTQPQQPQPQMQYTPQQPQPRERKGKRGLLIAALVAASVLLLAVIAVLVLRLTSNRHVLDGPGMVYSAPVTDDADSADSADTEKEEEAQTGPDEAQPAYETGTAGFAVADALSLTARAEGSYSMTGADGGRAELELYAVGANLYGFLQGEGYTALEFFPADETEAEKLASHSADEVSLRVLAFTNQVADGDYWNGGVGVPVRMELTRDGVSFETEGESGIFPQAKSVFERTDKEPGSITSFCYRSEEYLTEAMLELAGIEVTAPPPELIGLHRVLGSEDAAPVLEFTPEGLVQIYLKQDNVPVMLYRGSYAVGLEEKKGGVQVYMTVMGLGWSAAPAQWQLCYAKNEEPAGLRCLAGDESFGEGILSEGTVLLPIEAQDIPRAAEAKTEAFGALDGVSTKETFAGWLQGEWMMMYPSGNAEFATLTFGEQRADGTVPCTFERTRDGAAASGEITEFHYLYRTERQDIPELMYLKFDGIDEAFAGSMSDPGWAENYFFIQAAYAAPGIDYLHIREAGNGGPTFITDGLFSFANQTPAHGYLLTRRVESGVTEPATERTHLQKKNETFYGMVWNNEGSAIFVQHMEGVRFTEDYYAEQREFLRFANAHFSEIVYYPVTDASVNPDPENAECGMYRFTTDENGTITEMVPLTALEGDLTGLWEPD